MVVVIVVVVIVVVVAAAAFCRHTYIYLEGGNVIPGPLAGVPHRHVFFSGSGLRDRLHYYKLKVWLSSRSQGGKLRPRG